ncbi:VOC family protein [Terricaulis sp.]|jgi:catechol 2,3-dioxygenase-like lactoylglutathione lyase family enzyme|uniref:VOC family protein n=1 Tax=Terricaulis sp. TaxID=2768686 RepID=UPI002AC40730|nr:VOC family protein [Terricaulis sp.]MDZ4691769.1 VOC family protein [Terricaulis sp.]
MAQIGYVCLGANDFDRACAFYDTLTTELGGKKLFPTPHGQMYRLGGGAMIMVTRPYNEQEAHPGNGTMLAINVDEQADVARIYEKALSLGATCEGKPGARGAFGDFAYFRDPDGNKLAVFWTERQKKQ